MKTHVLTVSQTFPTTHPNAGKSTRFKQLILLGQKIHTIRLNYDYWKKRIEQVNNGSAYLSIRHWTGRPYNSTQEEYMRLYHDQVGVQKLEYIHEKNEYMYGKWLVDGEERFKTTQQLGKNDGLEWDDFIKWFSPIPPEPMAIIHFTNFRY